MCVPRHKTWRGHSAALVVPWAPPEGTAGMVWVGPESWDLLLLPAPPAGGRLSLTSPPKIGLTTNRQLLTSLTAGDPWPIARGVFARSRQA